MIEVGPGAYKIAQGKRRRFLNSFTTDKHFLFEDRHHRLSSSLTSKGILGMRLSVTEFIHPENMRGCSLGVI